MNLMKWLRKHQETYASYDPIERMNETLDHISDALDDILGELESHRAELEAMRSGVDGVATLIRTECPYCQAGIWGTYSDIDSGLRKHIEYCESAPNEEGE